MIEQLISNNLHWAAARARADPDRFSGLVDRRPRILWISCSEAALPLYDMLGLGPSDLVVHNNFGNLAPTQDPAGLSVLQFAVETVQVRHIIICGHYGCAAMAASMGEARLGLADHWLQPARALYARRRAECDAIREIGARANHLAGLNVASQARTLAGNPILLDAWRRGAALSLHGWMCSASDGLVRDLGISVHGAL